MFYTIKTREAKNKYGRVKMTSCIHVYTLMYAQEAARGKPATRLGKLQENQKKQNTQYSGTLRPQSAKFRSPTELLFWFVLFFLDFFDFFVVF